MSEIIRLISGHSKKDALDALYYAARFIKQAEQISKYHKDFFADDVRSAPSQEARDLALQVITAIELAEGCQASQFDSRAITRALKELTDAENSLDGEFSDAEEIAADSVILSMTLPNVEI